MSVNTLTIGLIIEPLTFIDITIRVVQDTLSIGFVEIPLANILATVGPGLRSNALTHAILPLPFVGNTIIKFYRG
jgi:hypothetical protein